MSGEIDYEITRADFDGNKQFRLRAGYLGDDWIVPPAGEEYAFSVKKYRREVTVNISPTGRSVRVWVDGTEVK